MATFTPTTELEAVNLMLGTIGEAPISSLEVSGLVDVAVAKQLLHEVSREVQSKGWDFNQEFDYPLARNTDGFVTVPSNSLRVDTTQEFKHYDVVVRGTRLYDRGNHSYTFTETLKVDMTVFLPFEEMPEAARYYIAIRAARKYQDRNLPNDSSHAYTEQDEENALTTLKEAEGDTGDYNYLSGSTFMNYMLDR
jgi:hypothetical protein